MSVQFILGKRKRDISQTWPCHAPGCRYTISKGEYCIIHKSKRDVCRVQGCTKYANALNVCTIHYDCMFACNIKYLFMCKAKGCYESKKNKEYCEGHLEEYTNSINAVVRKSSG